MTDAWNAELLSNRETTIETDNPIAETSEVAATYMGIKNMGAGSCFIEGRIQ